MAAFLFTSGADSNLKHPNNKSKDKPTLKKRNALFPTTVLNSRGDAKD